MVWHVSDHGVSTTTPDTQRRPLPKRAGFSATSGWIRGPAGRKGNGLDSLLPRKGALQTPGASLLNNRDYGKSPHPPIREGSKSASLGLFSGLGLGAPDRVTSGGINDLPVTS